MLNESISRLRPAAFFALVVLSLCSCGRLQEQPGLPRELCGQKVFALRTIAAEQASAFLSELGLAVRSRAPYSHTLVVTGAAPELQKAAVVLDLVDGPSPYVVKWLAPASMARTIPTNEQIARAVGLTVGTFVAPPAREAKGRTLIDLHGESVLAIMPSDSWERFVAVAAAGIEALQPMERTSAPQKRPAPVFDSPRQGLADGVPDTRAGRVLSVPSAAPEPIRRAARSPIPVAPVAAALREREGRESPAPGPGPVARITPAAQKSYEATRRSVGIPIWPANIPGCPPASGRERENAARAAYEFASLTNGEETLQLELPDTLKVTELLDLAAEYLNLDCMYDPQTVAGQEISLKLHGKLRGEIRVKDLYPVLESVLKFKGLVMTRHQDHLVTIVPVDSALEADPDLIDEQNRTIATGEMVVTRVFGLHYVNTATACGLLEKMKLSVALSPVEETQSLIVTCYAHRMARIEQLLELVDRPGRPKEFRFRQLRYALAGALIDKIEALAAELQMAPVRMASRTQDAPASVPPPARKVAAAASTTEKATGSANVEVFAGRAVYLDADERTNRIVMVGYAEELTAIDGIIDALDLAQQDLRVPRVYQIRRLHAADVLARLKDLEVVGDTPATVPTIYKSTSATSVAAYPATLEPQIRAELPQATAIEPTNALLIKATEEQHAYLATVIGHIDMMQDELRQLEVYDIQHVDAHDVKKKIEELRGKAGAALPLPPAGPVETGSAPAAAGPAREATLWETAPLEPQILVLETTNSVLVSAPEEQQRWVAEVIARIDVPARQEAIPYEIYFLENQEPEHMAEVLQKIIQETVRDKEGKIEKTVPKIDEEITIVPDQNTFAVIVYGNRRNQEWISKLIQTLDKRRPQVLIDATLVEIRRNDEFNYDLEMVAGIPDLTVPSGQTGQFLADENTTVTERLQQSGRDRIVDFQMSSGKGIGFYGDRHIQALLTAVQAKNYGRVLAKPKVLVNDNEKGSIKTADTTYVVTKSSIPVVQGAAGTQNQLIETAIRYEPYEAGITLNITPHTSEGDLLRLEIELTRSDFTSTSDDKPPNQTSSNVGTVITVPDGSTIILGGMLKLNQNRGGNKVPLLGDLPLVGGLFRSIDSRDIQSMLYIFVRAEIIRPAEGAARGSEDLKRISTENREAFEQHEHEFQRYELWPGVKPRPMSPSKALDAR